MNSEVLLSIDCSNRWSCFGLAVDGRAAGEKNLDLGRAQAGALPLVAEELLAAVDDLHKGRLLIEPLLWIILALALAEWGFANHTLRRESRLSDTLAIDSAGKVSGTSRTS